MTFGLTPLGFNQMRLADIKQSLENAFIAQFGDINIDPQSVFGQEIGVLSKPFADVWENLTDVYFSQYPNSAEGIALDNVVALNGIVRIPATQTKVFAVLSGIEGSIIPVGSLASIPSTNAIFSNPIQGVISRNSAYIVDVQVLALAAQVYTVTINNFSFIYSLPIITFTGSFVSGNVITVTLNGVALAPVNFTTDSDTTLGLIAAEIELNAAVLSVTAVGSTIINIIPNVGFSVVINFIEIVGGASQPTYAITFDTPATLDEVSTALVEVINTGSQPVTALDSSGTFSITSTSAQVSFSASVQTNLNITNQSSEVVFLSQEFGPIPAPASSLTQILSPIAGWNSINNPESGILGNLIESDSALRLRRQNSIQLSGNATVEAIRARLLQNVPNVKSVLVFENTTITQAEIDIIFSGPLVTGNAITITLNTRVLGPINFTTSNVFTMGLLASLISAQPEISSCVVAGATNNILQINMNVFQEVVIESVGITGGASQANYVINGGRSPKSFEVVIEGGTNADIAEEIWLSKPAGIATFGSTEVDIIDSMGFTHQIYFSRPTPIYIWVNTILTLTGDGSFPSNGLADVANAILAYGNSLGVGADIYKQRVNCAIFSVPGIASAITTLAFTNSPNDSPNFSGADIIIADNQISDWNIDRITVTV